MLIRSQDGKRVVETSEVWIQRHADRIIEHHYLFAATEIDPEGIILGQYDSEEQAIAVMARVLYKAELKEAVDLYREKLTADDQTVDLSLEALRLSAKRFGIPHSACVDKPFCNSPAGRQTVILEKDCPSCYTMMKIDEGIFYCPKCGVTV